MDEVKKNGRRWPQEARKRASRVRRGLGQALAQGLRRHGQEAAFVGLLFLGAAADGLMELGFGTFALVSAGVLLACWALIQWGE